MAYHWNESEDDILNASDYFAEAQRRVRPFRIFWVIGMVGAIGLLIAGIGMVVEQGFSAGAPWIALALLSVSCIGQQYYNIAFRAKALSLIHKLKRGEPVTVHAPA